MRDVLLASSRARAAIKTADDQASSKSGLWIRTMDAVLVELDTIERIATTAGETYDPKEAIVSDSSNNFDGPRQVPPTRAMLDRRRDN